jgi:hypothetical protein
LIDCQGNDLKIINYSVHQGPFREAVSRSAKLDVSRPYVIGMFVSVPREVKVDFFGESADSRPYPDIPLL